MRSFRTSAQKRFAIRLLTGFLIADLLFGFPLQTLRTDSDSQAWAQSVVPGAGGGFFPPASFSTNLVPQVQDLQGLMGAYDSQIQAKAFSCQQAGNLAQAATAATGGQPGIPGMTPGSNAGSFGVGKGLACGLMGTAPGMGMTCQGSDEPPPALDTSNCLLFVNNPDYARTFIAQNEAVLCTLTCESQLKDTLRNKTTCVKEFLNGLKQQADALILPIQNALTQTKQYVQDNFDTLEREYEIMDQDITKKVTDMNKTIEEVKPKIQAAETQIGAAKRQITTVQNYSKSIQNQKASLKAAYMGKCTLEERYTRRKGNNEPQVTFFKAVSGQLQDSLTTNKGRIETALATQAAERARKIQDALNRVEASMPKTTTAPDNEQEAKAFAAQPQRVLTPEDALKNEGAVLKSEKLGGQSIYDLVRSHLTTCFKQADGDVSRAVQNPESAIGKRVNDVLPAYETELDTMIANLTSDLRQTIQTASGSALGRVVIENDSDCEKKDRVAQLGCLQNLQTKVKGYVEGKGASESVLTVGDTNNPKFAAQVKCTGLIGCARVLKESQAKVANFRKFNQSEKAKFVEKTNAQLKKVIADVNTLIKQKAASVGVELEVIMGGFASLKSSANFTRRDIRGPNWSGSVDKSGFLELPYDLNNMLANGMLDPASLDTLSTSLQQSETRIASNLTKARANMNNAMIAQAGCQNSMATTQFSSLAQDVRELGNSPCVAEQCGDAETVALLRRSVSDVLNAAPHLQAQPGTMDQFASLRQGMLTICNSQKAGQNADVGARIDVGNKCQFLTQTITSKAQTAAALLRSQGSAGSARPVGGAPLAPPYTK